MYTFGESDDGRLGLGDDVKDNFSPQLVTGISEKIVSVACGSSHTVAVSGDYIIKKHYTALLSMHMHIYVLHIHT